jgi:uncharacterized membrane protein
MNKKAFEIGFEAGYNDMMKIAKKMKMKDMTTEEIIQRRAAMGIGGAGAGAIKGGLISLVSRGKIKPSHAMSVGALIGAHQGAMLSPLDREDYSDIINEANAQLVNKKDK